MEPLLVEKIRNLINQIPLISFLEILETSTSKKYHSIDIEIFGGFLRWIVENEKCDVNMRDFLLAGSDIDIKIAFGGKQKLLHFFKNVFDNGGAIEYVGIKYGETTPVNVDFSVSRIIESNRDIPIPVGHYMVWLPVVTQKDGIIPYTWRRVSNFNTKQPMFLKFDIMFGEGYLRTDFTVNDLEFPFTNYDENSIKSSLIDIRERRIRWKTTNISPKIFYRVHKLLRLGYRVFDPCHFFEMYVLCTNEQFLYRECMSKKSRIRQRNITEFIFTSDTNTPSMKPLSDVIRTTRHTPAKITSEMIKSDEYIFREVAKSVDTKVVLHSNPFPLIPNPETWAGESISGTLTQKMTFYKYCSIIKEKTKKDYDSLYVCLELLVYPGTLYDVSYHGGIKVYRFNKVTPYRCYAYPDVFIFVPSTHKLVSANVQNFSYTMGEEVVALDKEGNPVKTLLDNTCGIYAFSTLDEAWKHTYRNLYPQDIEKFFEL
jgi:hypothetical protein